MRHRKGDDRRIAHAAQLRVAGEVALDDDGIDGHVFFPFFRVKMVLIFSMVMLPRSSMRSTAWAAMLKVRPQLLHRQ